jgi:hypothetical protein
MKGSEKGMDAGAGEDFGSARVDAGLSIST